MNTVFEFEEAPEEESVGSLCSDLRSKRTVQLQGGVLKMTVSTESVASSFTTGPGSVGTVSIRTNVVDELENVYLERRTEVVMPDGFLSTPLHVLKKTAEEFDGKIHSEVFAINHNRGKIFRVEVFVGHVRGVGQSPRRKLSFQLAAADLLEKIKSTNNEIKLRPYALLPGCRTSVQVYTDLQQVCFQNNMPSPRYTKLEPGQYEEGPIYSVQCRLGDFVVTGQSDEPHIAKRLSAKKMFEALNKVNYPDMEVALGNQCLGMKSLRPHGIKVLTSAWKKAWMKENRVVGDTVFCPDDEPDDGDFDLGCPEDTIEELLEDIRLPRKGEMTGVTRVIKNEQIEDTENSEMEMED